MLENIRQLIARNELTEALARLRGLLEAVDDLDDTLLRSTRFQSLRRQIWLGSVPHPDSVWSAEQTRIALLDLLQVLEAGGPAPAGDEQTREIHRIFSEIEEERLAAAQTTVQTKKPSQVLDLEQRLGFALREAESLVDIMDREQSKTYWLNDEQAVIGLNLGWNQITDISFLQHLTGLTSLGLSENKITDISFLRYLTGLTSLDLSANQITDFSFLQQLTDLTSLKLSSNEITDFSFLQHLSSLTSLKLSSNEITDISFLQHLTGLTDLDLWQNQITDISFLQHLTGLTSLDLSRNQITDISFLQHLTGLTDLDLWQNQITDISFLQHLTGLISLDLSENQITDISFLQHLTGLTSLYLRDNQITTISFLQHLTGLTSLRLERNQITDISFLQHLTGLTSLDLSENQITTISLPFLNHFPNLYLLSLLGNPIQNIPKEIFDKGFPVALKVVRDYLEDLEKGKSANKEVKVIFIGNGSVGKTQIAKRLVEQERFVFDGQHHSTHAIALLRRELAGYHLNCWDFAGQDLYHATHRLFMQTRALLVLVWDYQNETRDAHSWEGKRYENEKLEYWLEYAQCFAPESPILVLQNKWDAFPQDFYFEYRDQLKKAYPILDFLPLSAKTGKGFMLLEEKLAETLSKHKAFQTPDLPTNWVAVRSAIIDLQAKREKTLSFAKFQALCSTKSASTILGYLHDTGVLYYREGYFQNQIILDQAWAIEAIYKVLDRGSPYFEVLEHQKGALTYKNICKIWDKNTDDERALFLDFMLSAELAFETTENKKYDTPLTDRSFAIPPLLPLEKPNDVLSWEHNNAQNLSAIEEITYRFLPKVFIQRFIVKASRFSTVRLMWQGGLLLETSEGSAIVEAHYKAGDQKIVVKASNALVRTRIKEELAAIAQEGKVHGKEGREETDGERFGLAGLKPIHQDTTAIKNMKKVFISYSHKDEAIKEKLDVALSSLKRSNKIATWNDREIVPGAQWDDTIKAEINTADIILLLISADFIASDYIWDNEIKHAIARHEKKEAVVIPIFCRACDFKELPFAHLQGLPKDAKPLASFNKEHELDEALTSIAVGIRKVVEEFHAVPDTASPKVGSKQGSGGNNPTIIQKADKIYNIGNIDNANFS